jgi:type VI secretion system protein ImpC
MLWGHPALIPALLLAETFGQQGNKMKLGSVMGVGDIAYYVYTDPDGDQIALPCTERLYSERQAVVVANYGVMPLLSLRGRPELRLGSFASVGGPALAGFWAPVTIAAKAAPQPAPTITTPTEEAIEEAPAELAMAEVATAEIEAETATETEPAVDTSDLDALLAGLNEPAETAAPAEEATDDLDALLASLNVEPPPAAADETETDLDALLASLN